MKSGAIRHVVESICRDVHEGLINKHVIYFSKTVWKGFYSADSLTVAELVSDSDSDSVCWKMFLTMRIAYTQATSKTTHSSLKTYDRSHDRSLFTVSQK